MGTTHVKPSPTGDHQCVRVCFLKSDNADKSPHHRRATFYWSCCINLTSSSLFIVYVIYQWTLWNAETHSARKIIHLPVSWISFEPVLYLSHIPSSNLGCGWTYLSFTPTHVLKYRNQSYSNILRCVIPIVSLQQHVTVSVRNLQITTYWWIWKQMGKMTHKHEWKTL
jgi:hypothetical protein